VKYETQTFNCVTEQQLVRVSNTTRRLGPGQDRPLADCF